MFEESESEEELITEKIFPGEKELRQYWEDQIREQLEKANLEYPQVDFSAIHFGGRKGHHTEFLHPMLEEMSQVYRLEEGVEW
jgi:ring-1,2-phenylacetyl-CoA epoxidase subunit PaaC